MLLKFESKKDIKNKKANINKMIAIVFLNDLKKFEGTKSINLNGK